MRCELDGRQMTDRAEVHTYIKEALGLPDWYGRNLDALYDLLTERRAAFTIVLTHADVLAAQLGDYADGLLDTLRDAAAENPALTFEIA